MSVTITIADNRQYCTANNLGRTVREECCTDHDVLCPCCHGHGFVEYVELPFELNLANGNFATLAAALGVFDDDNGQVEYCGAVDGRRLLTALRSLDPALVLRAPAAEYDDGRLRVFHGGLTREQVARYIAELSAIAAEAERREQPIVWG